MINDFYMFYRMRTSMTLSVKSSGLHRTPYSVKVTISDDDKTFEKSIIWRIEAPTPDRAINSVMDSLLNLEKYGIVTATKEELLEWDKL